MSVSIVDVFCSYAYEDELFYKELEKHLSPLQRQGLIQVRTERTQTISKYLTSASMILLLISPDFIASNHHYTIEMEYALRRQQSGQACVIPIILRSVIWQDAPFAHLQCLPAGGKPVTEWGDNLDAAFCNIAEGIRHVLESSLSPTPSTAHVLASTVWRIPYPRNPFFIGHEKLLAKLAYRLGVGHLAVLTQIVALSGLGGIGKTQLAIEYAYRSLQNYQAVLWSQAESREALISGYVDLAELLHLPAKDEQDQMLAVNAVKEWLRTRSEWLLILDNVDDMKLLREFLPTASNGHVLLTTRAQAMGKLVHKLEVETLETDLGALVLLRRAGILTLDTPLSSARNADVILAREITQQMGGLPLALDQAGAYIQAGCSLADYYRLYQERHIDLLRRRWGSEDDHEDDHPESVATTWSLSFERVEQANSIAAELLRLCANLSPDAIPEEMITEGAEHLGPVLSPVISDLLTFNDAIIMLRKYSLIRRDETEKTLNMHRLVQVVLKGSMDDSMRTDWGQRIIRMVNAIFPTVEFAVWQQCERYLPHALLCAEIIEQGNLMLLEAASLLYRVGWYLEDHARYLEAEPLYQRALAICKQQLELHHLHTAACLNNLALLYDNWGKDEQAEPLYLEALEIYELRLGPEHLSTATCLNNLAGLYDRQRKYVEAEVLYQRALEIREKQLGPKHPLTATIFSNLALLYDHQGKDEQAEPLYLEALEICKLCLGSEHLSTAISLSNLAGLYHRRRNDELAEPLYRAALAVYQQRLGTQHPRTTNCFNKLKELCHA